MLMRLFTLKHVLIDFLVFSYNSRGDRSFRVHSVYEN